MVPPGEMDGPVIPGDSDPFPENDEMPDVDL
jgi:hypothetical protein